MKAVEVNFDGLVGPTHNYSGLSYGNIASIKNQQMVSNPKEAALQGLKKMKLLAEMSIPQAVLPPHARPYLPLLRQLGFTGNDSDILLQAYETSPELLYAVSSAAYMWTANGATISPSADTLDGKLHITPANLSSKLHRSIEAPFTEKVLRKIFHNRDLFNIHSPLPQSEYLADEGAANHNRFCSEYSQKGIELFVWGRYGFKHNPVGPTKFPARQTYEASQAISRNHKLESDQVIFAQQNPLAIDAGVFHNDVISVGNEYIYLYHEKTFVNTSAVISELAKKVENLVLIEVTDKRISLDEAVSSYMFNSQIVTLPDKSMRLIAPIECRKFPNIDGFLQEIVQDPSNPIAGIDYLNLQQSMANGGGPACLRLRIVLTEEQLKAIHPGILLTDDLYNKLKSWIEKHYRDRLHPKDLADTKLLMETQDALQELTNILQLGSIYHFQ